MKGQKSIGLRIFLGIAAIACGIGVQVVGAVIDKILFIEMLPQYSFGVIGLLSTILGFVVMGLCVYKWAIK